MATLYGDVSLRRTMTDTRALPRASIFAAADASGLSLDEPPHPAARTTRALHQELRRSHGRLRDDEDGSLGRMDDRAGNAPDGRVSGRREAARAHDDEVDAAKPRQLDDLVGCIPFQDLTLRANCTFDPAAVPPIVRAPEPGCGKALMPARAPGKTLGS